MWRPSITFPVIQYSVVYIFFCVNHLAHSGVLKTYMRVSRTAIGLGHSVSEYRPNLSILKGKRNAG